MEEPSNEPWAGDNPERSNLVIPPNSRRKQPKFNVYCLQVSFCILFVWVVISNTILYIVFPPEGPGTTDHHRSSDGDDVPSSLVRDYKGFINRFLNAFKETVPGSVPLLLQPEILEKIQSNSHNFDWTSLVVQYNYNSLTFCLLNSKIPPCETMDLISQRSESQLSCQSNVGRATLTFNNLSIHLIATTKIDTNIYKLQGLSIHSSYFASSGVVDEFAESPRLIAADLIESQKSITIDGIAVNIPTRISLFIRELLYSSYIPCNIESAEKFFQRFPRMKTISESTQALDFRIKVRQILQAAENALNSLNIPFWLSSGTLLGWMRQCDVIPYSQDVDIGIYIQDYREDIIEVMEEQGLQLKFIFGKVEDSLQYSFYSKDVKLDVYFFYKENSSFWNGATKPETGEKFKYTFPQFALCWSEFLDLRLRVPCPTVSYLEANYGKDWFEPKESWDWRLSPPNSKPNGQWSEAEMKDTVQVYDHHSISNSKTREL